ncbi:hypothetical protein TNCV_4216941 [Trichonephila clavipes]|nr:hypothetical protein TNCV_4216941 [Trichonephila clavipes]
MHVKFVEGLKRPPVVVRRFGMPAQVSSLSLHHGSKTLATRGLLATDHVILNHGQVTWTTPELAPPSPNYHTTPTGGRFSSRSDDGSVAEQRTKREGVDTESVHNVMPSAGK